MRIFISTALLLTFFVGFAAKILTTSGDDTRGYIVQVGDKMPDFSMSLTNGSLVSTSDLKGKVIMLQFTASWCGVCRKEMPNIEKDIWQKYKDNKNFALFGIDRDEPHEKVVQFIKDVGVSYPISMDPGAEIFTKFANAKAGVTRNVIVDKSGNIAFLTRLFNMDEFEAMKQKIDELMQE